MYFPFNLTSLYRDFSIVEIELISLGLSLSHFDGFGVKKFFHGHDAGSTQDDMNGEVSQVRIEVATNVGSQVAMENLYTQMRKLFQEHLEAAESRTAQKTRTRRGGSSGGRRGGQWRRR